MNKENIIKDSKTFSEIISKKKSVKNIYFSIYYQKTEKTLFGITVPKKIGKAYQRNKIKRQLKNIIMTNKFNIQKGNSYVIIIKEAAKNLEYNSLKEELLQLIKKVRN